MKHLFLFTIGPVQSYISQARKTGDLYAGSRILSELTGFAINEIKKSNKNNSIIFPDEEILSKPNRFVAKIETENIQNFGEQLEQSVRDEFGRIAQESLGKLMIGSFKNEERFNGEFGRQIKEFLDIHWCSLQFDRESGKDKYKETFKKMDPLMGSIKNVRNFFPSLEESGRKCSLCGERNLLFYKDIREFKEKDRVKRSPFRFNKFAENLGKNSRIVMNDGEGLCGVCFMKRKYKETGSFPSTAKISLMDTLDTLKENDFRKEIDEYKNMFKRGIFDEQLLFEENLTDGYFKKNGIEFSEEIKYRYEGDLKNALAYIIKKRKEINEKAANLNKKMCKYYALVRMDGDKMGEWLSGIHLENIENLELFQGIMSRLLEDYSRKMDKEINDPSGRCVYSGGDDLLALINLKNLTRLLNKIRTSFPKFEDEEKDGIKLIKSGPKSTISAGVVIAHYKTPLSEVLRWAHNMEVEAKESGERDACALALLKHSGEVEQAVFKWDFDSDTKRISSVDLLQEIADSLSRKDFSGKFIENLNLEFCCLIDKNGDYTDESIIYTELKRLLNRAYCGEKEKQKEMVDDISTKIISFYNNSEHRTTFRNVLNFLHIARFIYREVYYAD